MWYFGFRDSDWLARNHAGQTYNLPDSKIQFEGTQPHDCDFLSASLGSKHCRYEREYLAEWVTLSTTNEPIVYGNDQESPPTSCSHVELDFAHWCYRINDLVPNEHITAGWHARSVRIIWRKVEE